MKKVFTKNQLINSLLVLAFALISNGIYAQYQLEVNSPASVAGAYEIRIAEYGDLSGAEVTGDAAVSANPDGCTASGGITGTTGFVAFIDRGNCNFTEKCLNATNDGAIAIVVCTPNDTIFTMPTGDDDVSGITIPCVMAKGSDCDVLKVEIANGLNVTLKQNSDCDLSGVSYPSNVIWGSELGQGDFSGGLNGWEFDKGWKWTTRGQIDSGAWNSSIPFADQSMTWCTGVMVMDSDHLDTEGVQGQTGGPCSPEAFPEGFCDGVLTSPIMDLSGVTVENGLVLQYTETTRQYRSEYYVIYSADGGSTWLDTVEVNQELALNTGSYQGNVRKIPLAVPSGSTEIKVRFLYRGNYYYWAIDDVMLLDELVMDVYPSTDWIARTSYYEMPVSQTAQIPFMADVDNGGNANATNAVLKVNVMGPGSSLLHEDEMEYGQIDVASSVDDQIFPDLFDIPAVVGDYTVNYEMTCDGENTPGNNMFSYDFKVNNNTVFSKVPADLAIRHWTPASDLFFTYGNIYQFPNEMEGGKALRAVGTKYSITVNDQANGDPGIYGGFINAVLYEWIDSDSDGTVQNGERTAIGEYEEFVSSSDGNNGIYTVDFEELSEGSLILDLTGNKTYILALNVAPGESDTPYFIGSASTGGSGTDFQYNYFATSVTFETLGLFKPQMVRANGQDANDVEDRVFTTQSSIVPRLPLYLEEVVGTEDINNDIKASIFPNPVKDLVSIELNLTAVSKDVNVQLVNMEGKVVTDNDFKNVKNTTLTVDATNLPTGVYMANIRTAEGFIAKRVVVQK